ncbi:hypothetical protein Tco_0490002 [Tanacetum coccineum]
MANINRGAGGDEAGGARAGGAGAGSARVGGARVGGAKAGGAGGGGTGAGGVRVGGAGPAAPETITQWFEKLNLLFSYHDCKGNWIKVKFAELLLSKGMRKWDEEEILSSKCLLRLGVRHCIRLKLKGTDIDGYTNRFHELALLCPRMVKPEQVKVEHYICRLSKNIRGDVTSSRPTSIDEAVRMAYQLMGQIIQDKTDEVSEGEKRKGEGDRESKEKGLEDVPVIRDFPEVFPDELPGFPPPRQVEFRAQYDLLPEGSEDFVVYCDASFKDLKLFDATEEKGKGDCCRYVFLCVSRKDLRKRFECGLLVVDALKPHLSKLYTEGNVDRLYVGVRQKSYVDLRRKPLEFELGDKVMLKVSPWKGVVRFGKRGKLSPRYIGPFTILSRGWSRWAYKPGFYPEVLRGITITFHVSNLKKCLSNEELIIPLDEVRIDEE